jgi:hypothetical protein
MRHRARQIDSHAGYSRPIEGIIRGIIMVAIDRIQLAERSVHRLATLALVAGTGGMTVSFFYLASSSRLDVLAGAAGFVAGAILDAAGLLALALLSRLCLVSASPAPVVSGRLANTLPSAGKRWIAYFQRNQENRPEPDWHAPITLSSEVVRPLVRSLEQFQLGDGGGPAYLIAWDQERFLSRGGDTRRLVDLWFAEEREHSRLLGALVDRFGGRRIHGHWSFTAFCWSRRWFGVRFELTVLLLTEIVSTVYYRLLHRHGADPALRSMCRLILRDETGHVAFHRDRLARTRYADHGTWWAIRFQALGIAAATMLWVNHAPGLRALGATRSEFYREVRRELARFILRLRRESSNDHDSKEHPYGG